MKANDKQMELINLETLQKQKKQDASGATANQRHKFPVQD